ncbi:MAG: ADP-forming succinate--CoA ligase subunit beta [Gammaproteobacteria bacterium]|nr:MAG: ADP-forming succinate--CoA ligase subunit beta [Gammaproteobacteria bacterium]
MNLHEYQAKKLFEEYGVPVSPGLPAHSIKEALQQASAQDGNGWVIKAQVHAGGRGKAGGVKLAETMEEVEEIVTNMFGKRLVTKQSGPEGQPINCVLVQTKAGISRELYLGLVVDRSSRKVAIMASSEGGMDIEEVAAKTPDKIFNIVIDPVMGLQNYQARSVSDALGLNDSQQVQLINLLEGLYQLFMDKDLSLIEINPLIIDDKNNLMCLDAKVSVDENALYRQTNLEEWRDPTQEDEKETIAKRYDLNYITLNGNIACMVNGAGLAMATMDIIKLAGGEPANFLDVGGGATADKVAEAFKLIVSDTNVEAILVNIFGGIVRCDLIAEGIIKAVKEVGVSVPIIVRLEGTNVEQGRSILAESSLTIITADNLADAATKVVAAAKGDH